MLAGRFPQRLQGVDVVMQIGCVIDLLGQQVAFLIEAESAPMQDEERARRR